MGERRCRKALSSPISCSCVRDKADAAFLLCSAPHDQRCSLSQYSMRARKNFSDLALLSLQSAPIPRKGKRPSLNLGDDTNFFAQFECAPESAHHTARCQPARLNPGEAPKASWKCGPEERERPSVARRVGELLAGLKSGQDVGLMTLMPLWADSAHWGGGRRGDGRSSTHRARAGRRG